MRQNFWLAGLFQQLAIPFVRTPKSRRRGSTARPAVIELLEPRQLLSATMLPEGPATQVNTSTTGAQFVPAVAMDAAGDYVVVWEGQQSPSMGQIGIFAQRYNAQGMAVGSEIHVNTNTSFSDTNPSVAMDASGDFVVTYTSNGQDGSRYGIYAQRFDTAGNMVGAEFRVNTFTLFSQTGGYVAMDSQGDFVVTWQSYRQQGGNTQIYAQRYNSAGAAVGGEFQVNTETTQSHLVGNVAMDAAGDFLITWRDMVTRGTFGQLYNSNGTTRGSVIEFSTGLTPSAPSVAMDAAGDFVILSDGGTDVFARRYNANGNPQGNPFVVNSYAVGNQLMSHVSMNASGDFVVVWQNSNDKGIADGVHAQRFDSAGTPLGGEIEVAKASNGQFLLLPSVAVDPNGDFVVVWQKLNPGSGNLYDVYAQRYHADFAPVLSQVGTSTLIDNGTTPISITTTLTASDIDNTTLAGATIKIATHYQNGQDQLDFASNAKITGFWDPSTGTLTLTGTDTVAAYQAALRSVRFQTTGINTSARTISFQVSDGQQGSNIVSRTIDLPPRVLSIVPVTTNPATGSTVQFRVTFSEPVGGVAVNDFSLVENGVIVGATALAGIDSVYTLTFSGVEGRGTLGVNLTNFSSIIDVGHNTVAQGFTGGVLTVKEAGPSVLAVFAGTGPNQLQNGGKLTASVTSFTVEFSENLNTTPGGAHSVTNPSNWQLLRGGVDVSNLISQITFAFDAATHSYRAVVHFKQLLPAGSYQLVAKQTIQDLAGSALNSDTNGASGGDFHFNISIANVLRAGSETRVNTTTGGNQIQPATASDTKGDYVVVWSSNGHDGSGYGVYAQRYNASGVAQGGEFRVNTYTNGAQESPAVAMDATGDFVITWQSFGQDGSSFGIYAQRYNANGVAQGPEFRVNTITMGTQMDPTVAMDATGDFIIGWWTPNNGDYAQRYNASGLAQGSNFRVNLAFTGNDSAVPDAAMDSTGAFVIAWGDHIQRYNASGVAQGNPITFTQSFSQIAVAMDAAGDFVVTGFASGFSNSYTQIFAQRFNSAGIAAGAAFRVSNFTTFDDRLPSVAMDASGDFVISWNSYGMNGFGQTHIGYYARRYGSDGTPQGPEFKVDSTAGLNFTDPPAVAMDARGDFVVAYKVKSDGSGSGIDMQRYQAT